MSLWHLYNQEIAEESNVAIEASITESTTAEQDDEPIDILPPKT